MAGSRPSKAFWDEQADLLLPAWTEVMQERTVAREFSRALDALSDADFDRHLDSLGALVVAVRSASPTLHHALGDYLWEWVLFRLVEASSDLSPEDLRDAWRFRVQRFLPDNPLVARDRDGSLVEGYNMARQEHHFQLAKYLRTLAPKPRGRPAGRRDAEPRRVGKRGIPLQSATRVRALLDAGKHWTEVAAIEFPDEPPTNALRRKIGRYKERADLDAPR